MTTAAAAPATLERYLRRATAGLPPAKRQEVWDELEEHVYARAEQLEWQGASPTQALSRALAELGPPLRVSAALNGVHNMPKMIAFGGAAALVLSATLYALAGGGEFRPVTTELPALSVRPVEPTCVQGPISSREDVTIVRRDGATLCFTFNQNAIYQGAFLGLREVQAAYEAAGIKTQFGAQGELRLTFPSGARRVLDPEFTANGQGYVPAADLIMSTVRQPLTPELKLTGYDNPLLSFGPLKLRLGTRAQPVAGLDLYRQLLPTLVGVLTTPDLDRGWSASFRGVNPRFPGAEASPKITVDSGLNAGEVALLLTRRDAKTHFADIAQAGAGGKITFYTEHRNLRFVGDLNALTPAPGSGAVPALLVKVTGTDLRNLKSGIFLPHSAR